MNIVEIKDLHFSYKDKEIFNNLNLNIRKNKFVTILGANNSGKSTLFRLMMQKYEGITINTENVLYINSNPNTQIVGTTVRKQLIFHSKQRNDDEFLIKKELNKIIQEFNLKEILELDPYHLTNEQKQIIIILSNCLAHPELLIMDDAMSFIGSYYKEILLKYLQKLSITIINITNNSEECLYSDNVFIINKKVILNKPLKKALIKEDNFFNNNIYFPFMAELSLKLKYYNIIDELILDENEMVDKIWS